MALIVSYNVEMQTTRKVLTVVDNSTNWNTANYMLADYFIDNPNWNIVRLNVTIEIKDSVINKKFVLTHGDAYEVQDDEEVVAVFGTIDNPVVDPKELRYSLLLSLKGDLVMINDLTNIDQDDYDVLPDGIYTIEYSVDSGTDEEEVITYKEEFVVTNGADDIVVAEANKIADTILTCVDTNIDNIADYLLNEGLLYACNKAAMISRKNRILNMLSVINKD